MGRAWLMGWDFEMVKAGALVAALGVALMAPSVALAEETAAADTAATSAPSGKDIVRLKNGGLLRGTITELLPGESVAITTATGKTREFPMSEVEYAGSAEEDPNAEAVEEEEADEPAAEEEPPTDSARPYATIRGKTARLYLRSKPAGMTFHRQGSSTGGRPILERLCVAPCVVELPAGAEELALSKLDGAPTKSQRVRLPARESEVLGTYVSKKGTRVAGVMVAILGTGVGLALMATAFDADQSDSDPIQGIIGGAIGGLSLGCGIALAVQRDVATFKVRPKQTSGGVVWPASTGLSLRGAL